MHCRLTRQAKSLSILVEMNTAQPEQLMPLAKSLIEDSAVVLNDTELKVVIAACNGSVRNVAANVRRMARRKVMKKAKFKRQLNLRSQASCER